MLKKLLIFSSLVCLFLGIAAVPAMASSQVKIAIDDQAIALDTTPVFRSNLILVPARQIVEAMGGDVSWNRIERAVTITKGETTIVLVVNEKTAQVNGQDVVLTQPPVLINGKVMVPLRFVIEGLNARVEWDAKNRSVNIYTPQNVDQELLAMLLESSKKSQEIKQFSAELDADVAVDTVVSGIGEKFKFSMVGDMKFDIEKQDFSFTGKIGLKQGVINRDFNFEMVMKDKIMYIKDPFSGKWQKQTTDTDESGLFNQSLSQSVETQVYYNKMIEQVKDEGIFRTVSFAGEKNINGIDTRGIFVEINGLKITNVLREMMPQIYQQAGIDQTSEIDQEELNQTIDEIFSALALNKLNYTVWIGKNDNVPYQYNGEFSFRFKDPTGESAKDSLDIGFDMNFDMTIGDINKPQNIEAPVVVETTQKSGL